ncbi:MAG: AhpC/TSA family protein [Flavobacteriales bacterium]|nr:AhpC/TSA family protein [Flavobacteriales bacterium]
MKSLLIFCLVCISSLVHAQSEMYEICPIKNSEEIPSAILYQQDGIEIDLKDYIGDRKAVLVFYRGGWCPYCMRHLSALQEAKDEIEALDYEIIAITPDDFMRLDTSIKKGKEIDYKLFSDKDINAISAFGIGWKINDELYAKYKDKYNMDVEWWSGSKHHVLPVPAVFVVSEGKINYQHVDPKYSKRLSTNVLLSFLKSSND